MAKQQCNCQRWPYKSLDELLTLLLTGHHEKCSERTSTGLDEAFELIKGLLNNNDANSKLKAQYVVRYIDEHLQPTIQDESPKESPPRPRRMTLEQAKSLYMAVADPPHEYDDAEWRDIYDEMEAIVAAPGPKIAAKVVEWWEIWDKKNTAVRFVKRIRALAIERGILKK